MFILDMKKHEGLLINSGKHNTGIGCLYINKLEDVDLKVLEELIEAGRTKIILLINKALK